MPGEMVLLGRIELPTSALPVLKNRDNFRAAVLNVMPECNRWRKRASAGDRRVCSATWQLLARLVQTLPIKTRPTPGHSHPQHSKRPVLTEACDKSLCSGRTAKRPNCCHSARRTVQLCQGWVCRELPQAPPLRRRPQAKIRKSLDASTECTVKSTQSLLRRAGAWR